MPRKLKPLRKRKPKERVNVRQIVKEVSKETGFARKDVNEVVYTTIKVICKHLLSKKTVIIPTLGILFPAIKPSRVGMALNGGVGKPKKVTVPHKWLLKFVPGEVISRDLSDMRITRDDVNDMYED